jgi:WD40 repeat protein
MNKIIILILVCITSTNVLQSKNSDIAWMKGGNTQDYFYTSFSPNGKYILTVSFLGAKIWSVETGNLMRMFPYDLGYSSAPPFVFSPNGDSLYFADSSRIKCWNLASDVFVGTIHETKSIIKTLALSVDGSVLLSGGNDSAVTVWDLKNTYMPKNVFKLSNVIWKLGFIDNERCIFANQYNRISIVEVSSGKILCSLKYEYASFSNLNNLIAVPEKERQTSAVTSEIKIYDIAGKLVKDFNFPRKEQVREFFLTLSGNYLVTSCTGRFIKIYDTKSGVLLRTIIGKVQLPFAVSPREDFLISKLNSDKVGIWDFNSGELITQITTISGYENSRLAISADERYLAFASSSGELNLVDVKFGRILQTFTNHIGDVKQIITDEQNQNSASLSSNGKVLVWSTSNGKTLWNLQIPDLSMSYMTFSHDGKYLATYATRTVYDPESAQGNYHIDSVNLALWNMHTGSLDRDYNIGLNEPPGLTFSKDDKNLITVGGTVLKTWDINSEKILQEDKLPQYGGFDVFSPNTNYLIDANYDRAGRIAVWDIGKKTLAYTLYAHSGYTRTASFSKDEKILVSTGQDDKNLKVWGLPDGKMLKTFNLDIPQIRCGSVSPSGRYYAGGNINGLVTIWNLADGKKVRSYDDYQCDVFSMKWSPDEKLVFSGHRDGTIIAWRPNL